MELCHWHEGGSNDTHHVIHWISQTRKDRGTQVFSLVCMLTSQSSALPASSKQCGRLRHLPSLWWLSLVNFHIFATLISAKETHFPLALVMTFPPSTGAFRVGICLFHQNVLFVFMSECLIISNKCFYIGSFVFVEIVSLPGEILITLPGVHNRNIF